MKKRKNKKIVAVVCVSVFIITQVIVIRILKQPYLQRINSVVLPSDSQTIKTKVSLSDVYGIHVCAEKVICTQLAMSELEQFIKENNSKEVADSVFLIPVDKKSKSIAWDDYNINIERLDLSQQGNYFYLSWNTPYCQLSYD